MDRQKLYPFKEVWRSPELTVARLAADTDQEAIAMLAGLLYEQGAVKESFLEAVAAREKEYPTGLQFEKMGIALPHTDAVHVNHHTAAIGMLERPVAFRAMGMPGEQVEVSLIAMLAVAEPEKETYLIGSLIDWFQNPANLEQIRSAGTAEEAAQAFLHIFT